MSILIAFIIAAIVVVYWVQCRRAALKHQIRAVELIEEFINDESVSDQDADVAYGMYRMARSWLFMPAMSIMVPFAFAISVWRGDLDKPGRSGRRQKIMDSIMQMYMTRNPLTSVVCMLWILLTFSFILPVGILLNRIRAIPSAASFYGVVANATATASVAHARHHSG